MNRWFVWILATLLSLALAGPAASQATDVGRQNLHHGTLQDIDYSAKTFTVDTRTGPETFTLWTGAEITGGDERKTFDQLAVGEYVAVRSMQDDTDRWLVRSIQVIDPNELEGQLRSWEAYDTADTVTIVDTTANTLQVETVDGPRVYQLGEDTRIVRGGDDVEAASLKPQERVVVTANETAPGQFTAKIVTVVSAGPAPVDRPEAESTR